MKTYTSLIGPLLNLYYPLPDDLNEVQQRLALNTSKLKELWCSIYTLEEVMEMVRKFGGIRLPDFFAHKLDYDSHIVYEARTRT